MPRIKDVVLADRFTSTTHTHPTPALDPSSNPLPSPYSVLVIGASRGIGAHVAYSYAQAGAGIIVLAARESSLPLVREVEAKVQELNPKTKTLVLGVDITSDSSVEELARSIREEVQGLDIVVLNSGYSGPVILKVTEGSAQDFQDVLNVNVFGTYLVARHCIPLLKAKPDGPRLFIAVGSFAANIINGHIANTAYCLSKFAQARLVEFLNEQYGKEEDGGVISVGVHPGAVASEMALKTTPESFLPYLTDDPSLCGAFCVWLSQERREWLNGRLISATWDVEEFLKKKGAIEEGDILKMGYRMGV